MTTRERLLGLDADPVRRALDAIEDAELRDAVIGLFDLAKERVAEGVDLVVLCARRLPCLYTVLLEAGYEPIAGATVVSDRFLDHATGWTWKNVLILDDTVVLGTTLTRHHARITESVARVGGGVVSTAAICVDVDKRADVLLDRLSFTPLVEASTERVREFGKNVVTCLFRNNVPFFSDFPVTVNFALRADEFESFAQAPGWHLADVTTPLLAAPNQAAYVQLPDVYKTDEVLTLLPLEVRRLVSAFKIRSYVTRSNEDVEWFAARLVPLALLVACREDELDAAHLAFSDLMRSGNAALPDLSWGELDGCAKHRLLQLLLSHFVLAASVPPNVLAGMRHTRRHLRTRRRTVASLPMPDLDYDSSTDPGYLTLYFGGGSVAVSQWYAAVERYAQAAAVSSRETARGHVFDRRDAPTTTRPSGLESEELIGGAAGQIPRQTGLLNDDELRRLLWAQREIFTHARSAAAPDRGQMTKVGLAAAHAISSLFGYISSEFEDPQQEVIRNIRDYQTYVRDFVKDQDRRILNKVFTMDDLAGALVADRTVASSWDRALVSLGIDVGNDLGIAVPTTRHDATRGLVYRAYRLGETAQLADKPLSTFVEDGLDLTDLHDLDEFSQTIADGYPVVSFNAPFALPSVTETPATENTSSDEVTSDRTELADLRFRELKSLLERSLPRRIAARYDGQIRQVEEEWFAADLREIPTLTASYARIDRIIVQPDDVALLGEGVTFRLTIFEPPAGAAKDGAANMRLELQRSRVIEPAAIAHAMTEFAFLANDAEDSTTDHDDDLDWDEWTSSDHAADPDVAIDDGVSPQTVRSRRDSTSGE